MAKICVNNRVRDHYMSGMSLNDSIMMEYKDEIDKRIKDDASFSKFTPLNMAMYDAGINKYSTVGDLMNTATYTTTGPDSNDWLFSAFMDSRLSEATYANDIIQYLVTSSMTVDSNIVKNATLDLTSEKNKNALKKSRVAEGADIPLAKIQLGERAISLVKRGRAISATYEAIRRMRIDTFTKHLDAIANDVAQQEKDFAIDTLLSGDGNNDAATSLGNMTGGLTSDNLVDLMIEYYIKNNFAADTIVVGKEGFKALAKMTFNKNLAPGASTSVSFNMPQVGMQNVNVLYADLAKDADKDVILLFNRANTLTRYVEAGSSIQEFDRFIRNQTNLATITINSGYGINMLGSNMKATF